MQHEGLAQMCCLIRAPGKTVCSARPSEQREMQGSKLEKEAPSPSGLACKRRTNRLHSHEPFLFFRKISADNSLFYLRAFEGSLETNRSTAVTLVPIAPPGGRMTALIPTCQQTRSRWINRARWGEKASRAKSMRGAGRGASPGRPPPLLSPPW